jgi:indolepyruvate decarboxylase
MSQVMSVAEVILHACKEHGAREVFGIPGDFALPFFKVIEETKILPLYTLSHEPGVGFAADAAARYRGTPSVAAVTYGAGALNMVNPIAAAYAEKSPVIVISGAPGAADISRGLLLHHQAKSIDSQRKIFQEITCHQILIDDPSTAPDRVATCLRKCIDESRPVYIELPRDLVNMPCKPALKLARAAPDSDRLVACVDEIFERLNNAGKPVVVVGVEVRRFGIEKEVAELTVNLNIPVVTSLMGRGVLARSSNLPIGSYLGRAGEPGITKMVEESDLLILLGVILSDTNLGISERSLDLKRSVVISDNSVSMGFHIYPDIPIDFLVKALNQRISKSFSRITKRPNLPKRDPPVRQSPFIPEDIADIINEFLAAGNELVIASDMGDCFFTSFNIEHTELVAPGYYATMGFGVPAGLGLQVVTERRVLILVGDGAFQMTGWELGNCQRYGWDPIVVVFNNRGWEMLRVFQPESQFNDLEQWSFDQLALSLGGRGWLAEDKASFRFALSQAISERGIFHLIDTRFARGIRSQILTSFVEGVTQ